MTLPVCPSREGWHCPGVELGQVPVSSQCRAFLICETGRGRMQVVAEVTGLGEGITEAQEHHLRHTECAVSSL